MKEIIINDWIHLQQILDRLRPMGDESPVWSFRGQSNSDWCLEPSLTRIAVQYDLSDPVHLMKIEGTLFRYFISNIRQFPDHNSEIEIPQHVFRVFTLMQHYGSPTRLLDWTHSPLIALYYAVREQWNSNGAMFVVNNKASETTKDSHGGSVDLLTLLEPDFRESLSMIMSTYNSKRAFSQQGLFSISNNPMKDHQELIEKLAKDENDFVKLVIPSSLKLEFLQKLRSINVKADILFPDAFGLGQELANICKIRSHKFQIELKEITRDNKRS